MSNTPFSHSLPRQIDPRKFAQQGIEISGSVPLNLLPRVGELLSSGAGDIQVSLAFGLDEQRLLTLTGVINANVEHICQRCLGPVPVELNCQLKLAIVWDEEKAESLPQVYDAWVLGEGATDLYAVIEDELLLSLPIVSYHAEECIPHRYFSSGKEVSEKEIAQDKEQKNPFQVLKQLKTELKPASESIDDE